MRAIWYDDILKFSALDGSDFDDVSIVERERERGVWILFLFKLTIVFVFYFFFSNKSFGHLVCVSLIVAPSSCCQFHDFFLLIHQPHLGSGSYFFGLKKIKLNLVLSSCWLIDDG